MSNSLTIHTAAEQLDVSADTVRRWADAGLLPSFRLPSGHRRFSPAEVDAFRRELVSGHLHIRRGLSS